MSETQWRNSRHSLSPSIILTLYFCCIDGPFTERRAKINSVGGINESESPIKGSRRPSPRLGLILFTLGLC